MSLITRHLAGILCYNILCYWGRGTDYPSWLLNYIFKQDCFLQKEARVCVSNAFVIEDSKFKWCFFVVEAEQVAEEADMLM